MKILFDRTRVSVGDIKRMLSAWKVQRSRNRKEPVRGEPGEGESKPPSFEEDRTPSGRAIKSAFVWKLRPEWESLAGEAEEKGAKLPEERSDWFTSGPNPLVSTKSTSNASSKSSGGGGGGASGEGGSGKSGSGKRTESIDLTGSPGSTKSVASPPTHSLGNISAGIKRSKSKALGHKAKRRKVMSQEHRAVLAKIIDSHSGQLSAKEVMDRFCKKIKSYAGKQKDR